jgi:hypothetical protein
MPHAARLIPCGMRHGTFTNLYKKFTMKNGIEIFTPAGYGFAPLSKFALAAALFSPRYTTFFDSSGVTHNGKVVRLECEDGSGQSYNVTIQNNMKRSFHVRTID